MAFEALYVYVLVAYEAGPAAFLGIPGGEFLLTRLACAPDGVLGTLLHATLVCDILDELLDRSCV